MVILNLLITWSFNWHNNIYIISLIRFYSRKLVRRIFDATLKMSGRLAEACTRRCVLLCRKYRESTFACNSSRSGPLLFRFVFMREFEFHFNVFYEIKRAACFALLPTRHVIVFLNSISTHVKCQGSIADNALRRNCFQPFFL